MFADNFGKKAEGSVKQHDLDNNGTVDFGDFFTFADNFGKTIPGNVGHLSQLHCHLPHSGLKSDPINYLLVV